MPQNREKRAKCSVCNGTKQVGGYDGIMAFPCPECQWDGKKLRGKTTKNLVFPVTQQDESMTPNTNPVSEIMAEYMEKFGKKLNMEESRTGDELFMWLKSILAQFESDIRKDELLRIAEKINDLSMKASYKKMSTDIKIGIAACKSILYDRS